MYYLEYWLFDIFVDWEMYMFVWSVILFDKLDNRVGFYLIVDNFWLKYLKVSWWFEGYVLVGILFFFVY